MNRAFATGSLALTLTLSLLLTIGASASLLLATGCTRGVQGDERDDARTFDEALAADQALEAALRDVDATSRIDEKKAAELVDSRAIALADRVVERSSAVAVKSAWGKERKDDLVAVARRRREELPRYARALRDGDLKTKLEAVEAQLELQRKAMEAASRVSRAPR